MTLFLDTSGVFAYLDANDDNHPAATALMLQIAETNEELLTHNYVVVEAAALLQRRLGSRALRALLEDIVPRIDVVFVDESLHQQAVAANLAALRASIVDLVSFAIMRERGIERAFAYDDDFTRAGFDLARATRRE